MSTQNVILDTTQYVRINDSPGYFLLQSHGDTVRIAFSELKPSLSNTSHHDLGGQAGIESVLPCPYVETYIWALAMTKSSKLSITKLTDNVPVQIADGDNFATVSDDGQLHVVMEGKVDVNNSTTGVLGADAVFTGSATNLLPYAGVSILIGSDVAGSLSVEFGPDGEDWHSGETFSISPGTDKFFTPPAQSAFYRLVYTNGPDAQTSFYIHSVLKKQAIKWSSHNIDMPIVDEDDAELVKAVITGKKTNGVYDNVNLTNGANMKISLEELETGISDDSNSALKVSPYAIDEYANIARLLGDNIFKGSLVTIPPEHHEIHCGDSYEMSYITDLGNGGVLDILIIVPNEGLSEVHPGDSQDTKQYHFKGTVSTESEATVEFFESVTVSANGTALDVFCRNRNFSSGDEIDMYHTPTVTTTGTRLVVSKTGSGRSSGGMVGRADEFILKDNTLYLLRITNNVVTNEWVSVNLDYYVHPGV